MARRYDNTSRSQAARETRGQILRSARDLIVEQGYPSFSIAALAGMAGVSAQTIYNAVGGKAEVLKAAYDLTLAGDDDPVPMSERPAFRALGDAPTVRDWAAAYAHWTRVIHDRVGTLVAAVLDAGDAADAGSGAFAATIDRERRIGTTDAVTAMAARHGLAPGLTLPVVVDAVWVLNSPEVYGRLVGRCGWSADRYEAWLAGQLAATLSDGVGWVDR